ncbi:MAG: hypothetical protein BGO78_14590 [Chloroflexi bacterium 44-23]|nr:MAG: hypothetical protein BGO78_14590 [Chloroflexi bacterium 44-23]
MAFDQTTRNRLARFVSDARVLLTGEFTRQLQHEYGIDPVSGEVTPIERLTALDDRKRETARILRETLDYYLAGVNPLPSGRAAGVRETLDRIVREQAFTILNRLCAFRMSEARGLVLESIANGYQSKGFQLYTRLAGSALGEMGEAYRMYLFSLMDEFAVDLPVLFDRFSPQGRLFPRETALLKLLELINDPEIDPLWTEDETIGWIYQYFNSKEERKAMRDASQAPRNSRELAVRNQFFTPRYVVEFLTDNTLGRIWYEMTKGETALIDSCRYLVRRKHAFFLAEGQTAPKPFLPEQLHETDPDLAHEMWLPPNDQITDLNIIFLYGLTADGYDYARKQWGIECGDLANKKLKQYHESGKWEGTFDELRCCLFFEQRRYHHFGEGPEGDNAKAILDLYRATCERWNLEVEFIPHRPLKDPREIKMLDPACGSMHFGLYAFDLFEQIYAEAWELEERLGEDALQRLADLDPLHKTYSDKDAYLRDISRLIIERNVHGVDIDPRAVQIAGLSLWLRAQKSWQTQRLCPSERPQIRKSNVVCAEPMPGDRQMLEEFLGTLQGERLEALMRKAWYVPADKKVRATPQMAEALTKLVRAVWQEMELAGEAGSLLKIEETLRDAISIARKESEEKSPLFRVLDYGLTEPPKEKYVQVVSSEEQDFFYRAEGLVLVALGEYAERTENGEGYRRRLFVGDVSQGFKFINLSRKMFDIVLMNPPFGKPSSSSISLLKKQYADDWKDIYAAFIKRMQSKLDENGMVGAITSLLYLYSKQLRELRKNIITKNALLIIVELGSGVLDDAAVETALSVFVNNGTPTTNYLDLFNIIQKDSSLLVACQQKQFTLHNLDFFENIYGWPLCLHMNSNLLHLWKEQERLEPDLAEVVAGNHTFDDFRFLRLRNEVSPESLNKIWFSYEKGGEYQPLISPTNLVFNWSNNGAEPRSFQIGLYGTDGQIIQSISKWFRPGLTYPRVNLSFSPKILPSQCIFSEKGMSIFLADQNNIYALLGLLVSSWSDVLLKAFGRHRAYENRAVANLPYGLNLLYLTENLIGPLTKEAVRSMLLLEQYCELSPYFLRPLISSDDISFLDITEEKILKNIDEIDNCVQVALNINKDQFKELATTSFLMKKHVFRTRSQSELKIDLFMWIIGCLLGRWDIRHAFNQISTSDLSDPFAPLPAYPPGMLHDVQDFPAASQNMPSYYPLRISWSGILVDDEGHFEDIEGRIRNVLHIIWGERVETIEDETCQILGVHTIREYYNKPALFFADHLKRYSKSRRAAPIYWPLSTPSCSYTLWLYYHRLNDQTLYTCVNDFVDVKLKQVSEEAARLRLKKGRSAADEKELERLTDFERELKDFREELLRVAKFWKPNLNDGVEITAAPLWKLFQHKPWQKRLRETWSKLESGEYDWAHLAYSIWPERVREKCKTDKSIAIAHDLEELYVEPPASVKKKKAKKPAIDEETEGWFNDD